MKATKRPGRLRSNLTTILILAAGALVGVSVGMIMSAVTSITHMSVRQLLAPAFEGRRQFCIVALGEDNTGSTRKDVRGRSDTIMVAAVDLDSNVIRAVSIPRDTRCIIPGHDRYEKINTAYALGGPELSRRTAEALLGIPIQYYVETNIEGLKRTVDLLGGVEIDIEKDMRYHDRRGGLYINLRKGYRHLDGDKALQYVRFRHDAMGDIWRIRRQQKFMRAIARRMFAAENVTKLPTIVEEIRSNMETNLTAKDLLVLARLGKKISPDDVQMETLPGQPQNIDGISYWVAAESEVSATVDQLLRFSIAGLPPAASGVKPTVEVLNGAGVAGIAGKAADILKRSGYSVMSTRNAANFGYAESAIQTRIGTTAQVRDIGTLMRCTRICAIPRHSSTEADVTIIVGKDFNP